MCASSVLNLPAALLKGDEWKPHKIQGWTPDFVPAVLNRNAYDELRTVSDDDAFATARPWRPRKAFSSASPPVPPPPPHYSLHKPHRKASVLLAMLPDTGERYFSSPLFADINEGSDDEWLASLG